MEEQFIGIHILQWDAQFVCNGRNKTVKTAGNQIDQFVRCTQVLDEFSKQTENDYVGVVRRRRVMGRTIWSLCHSLDARRQCAGMLLQKVGYLRL